MEKVIMRWKKDVMSISNILICAAVLCIFCGFIGMFFIPALKWWLGVIFGYLIAVLCFRLLFNDIKISVTKTESGAKRTAFTGYTARYLIKGLCLYASIICPYLCMGSCAFGLVSINLAINVLNILNIYFAKSKERE